MERAGGPLPVGLRLAQMQQAQPPEAAVDRVPADRAEPAQPPQRAGAAHHPRGLLGREREVREVLKSGPDLIWRGAPTSTREPLTEANAVSSCRGRRLGA